MILVRTGAFFGHLDGFLTSFCLLKQNTRYTYAKVIQGCDLPSPTPSTINFQHSLNSIGIVVVIAVCFACGREKQAPLIICDRCQVRPISQKDRITSMCLSDKCLSQKNLEVGSKYIRKNNKRPKFHETVQKKATRLIEAVSDSHGEHSQSFEFSNSFFDFQGLTGDKGETVQVHAIGKPVREGKDGIAPVSNLGNRESTYQVLSWEIGKDLTFDEADLHMDDEGKIYVWYRWMGNSWTWKPVSQEEFFRLKDLEG